MGDYNSVKKYILDVATKTDGGGAREDTCQYRGTDRWCKMTTNTKCKKCKFYTPTIQATYTAAYNEVMLAKEAYEANVALEKEIKKILQEVRDLKPQALDVVNLFSRLHIAENMVLTLWQDSVNSYE